jgi:CDP-6-deoxy-D-xylo-4-hexulose-3-dehydrase
MIRLHEPTFGEEEIAAVAETMRSTWVTQGAKVREFEDAFCEKFGFRHAVACNSGSSANLLAVGALVEAGLLMPGDEMIVPAVSWPTTVWPTIQLGLVPLVVDCDIDTLNIDPEAAWAATQALAAIFVHVYGNVCEDLNPPAGTVHVEDCCEALGIAVPKYNCISTYSFYFSHHITTMEGGMVGTDDDDLADIMRCQRSHGWMREVRDSSDWPEPPQHVDPRHWFPKLGYNLRMTEPQAAMGLIQLPKLEGFVEKRRWAHDELARRLIDVPGLILQKETPGTRASWFGFTIISEKRAAIVNALNAAGVETRPIIAGNIAVHPGLTSHPHRIVGGLPNANRVLREGFSIPGHHALSEEDIDLMATTIEEAACAP